MVLVGLLPILAFAGSIQAAAIPVDSPPPSPALSLHGSSTFSPIPSFSPQLNVPSPTLPSAVTVPTPDGFDHPSTNFGNSKNVNSDFNGNTNANGNANYRSSGGVGRGKGMNGMTNAERMRRGLGILPPTRRMSSKPVRRSAKPEIDAAQFQSPQSQPSADNDQNDDGGIVTTPTDGSLAETSVPQDTNDSNANPDSGNTDNTGNTNTNNDSADPNTTNTNQDTTAPLSNGDLNQNPNSNTDDSSQDDDTANPGGGRVLASRKYAMRMVNPDDGSDMGWITGPDGNDNPLVGYSPNPDSPIQMNMPTDPTSTPFSIVPNPSDNNNDDGNGDGDGSTYNGPRRLLAAVPHRTSSSNPGSSDLMPGDGNYAPLGMGWSDASGLLHLNIKALIQHPSSTGLPVDPTSGLPIDPTSGLPVDPSNLPTDPNGDTFGVPKQLLSRPGGSVLPINPSSATEGLPSGASDPTNLLHGGISNLPIDTSNLNGLGPNGGEFGDPQSTIWTFHPDSQRLLAHYVNSDGNTVPTYFVTGGDCLHTICLTGDVHAFKDAQGDGAHEVHVLAEAVADL